MEYPESHKRLSEPIYNIQFLEFISTVSAKLVWRTRKKKRREASSNMK